MQNWWSTGVLPVESNPQGKKIVETDSFNGSSLFSVLLSAEY